MPAVMKSAHLKVAWQMIAASLVMGVAVCSMHYTGMAAASFSREAGAAMPQISAVSTDFLAYTVFLVSLIITVLGIAFGRVDTSEEFVLE